MEFILIFTFVVEPPTAVLNNIDLLVYFELTDKCSCKNLNLITGKQNILNFTAYISKFYFVTSQLLYRLYIDWQLLADIQGCWRIKLIKHFKYIWKQPKCEMEFFNWGFLSCCLKFYANKKRHYVSVVEPLSVEIPSSMWVWTLYRLCIAV